jgi:hypothetical protein
MSTDRDLLEAAAKAAGFVEFTDGNFRAYRKYNVGPATKADGALEDGCYIDWNPLIDDGQALRLAVKLRIDLQLFTLRNEFRPHDTFARAIVDRLGRTFSEPAVADDDMAATRRAIVRAAAAIGAQA